MNDRRTIPRFVLGLDCAIRMRGSTARPAKLIDISQRGYRVETISRLHAGGMIWLSAGPLKGLVGTITWASANFAGVVFDNPLHDGIIDELTRLAGRPADERQRLDELAHRIHRQAAWSQTTYEADSLQQLAAECLAGRLAPQSAPDFQLRW